MILPNTICLQQMRHIYKLKLKVFTSKYIYILNTTFTQIFERNRYTKFWHGAVIMIMTSLSNGTADWFSPVSVANELAAQHSNTWLVFAVAVAHFRNPPATLPQLHLYRSATGLCMLWGLFMLYVQQQYILHAHSSIVWMYWQ